VLRLSVPNTLAAIEALRLRVRAFIEPYRLNPRVVYRLELVLEEALMNRKMHAFAEGSALETDVTVEVRADAVVLGFEDSGIPFDPTRDDVPLPVQSAGEAPLGGRGLLLTRKAASAIDYRRVGDRNQMTVRLARH
jgi:serine/threonine-protein kinase RsbW